VSDPSYPVTVLVKRADGSTESVRVGTAVRAGDGFRLTLGELAIGATPDAAFSPARRPPPPSGDDGPVFPPYGRSKGAPIRGASVQDLEFYISGSRRTLDDPGKARWHDKERSLLAVMEAELARQRGDTAGPSATPAFDDFGAGAPEYSDDDDIPF